MICRFSTSILFLYDYYVSRSFHITPLRRTVFRPPATDWLQVSKSCDEHALTMREGSQWATKNSCGTREVRKPELRSPILQ